MQHAALLQIAEDRYSARRKDVDGRMHVDSCNISKANVCPYLGREIPGHRELGLDANRIYNLYRDPAELARGAATFERLQLLEYHKPVNADAPERNATVGTVANVTFDGGYLRADLTVWDQGAIEQIEARELAQISCGYRYRAEMVPGTTPDGVAFDGVMRDIIGNHVALVRVGRAGPDVVVADEQITEPVHMSFKRSSFVSALAGLVGIKLDTATPDQKATLTALDEAADAEFISAGSTGPTLDPAALKLVTQDELQTAVAAAVVSTRETEQKRATDLRTATDAVLPLVGAVSGMDSAEAVYRFALDKSGVEGAATMHSDALAPLVTAMVKAKGTPPIAADAAPPLRSVFAECFPGAASIRSL